MGTCRACGARARVGKVYRLCRTCWDHKPTRKEWLVDYDLPLDDQVCSYVPGSKQKIARMRARVAMGLAPCMPGDVDMGAARPGEIAPRAEESSAPRAVYRVKGAERSRNYWRARPYCGGKKACLGSYSRKDECEAVLARFWREECGLFAMLGGAMGEWVWFGVGEGVAA